MQLQKTKDHLKNQESSWGYLYHQNNIIAGRLKNVDWRTNQVLMSPVEKPIYPTNPHQEVIKKKIFYNKKCVFFMDTTTEFRTDSERNVKNYIRLCNLKYEMEFFDMFHKKRDLEKKIRGDENGIVIVPRNFSLDNLK